MSDDLRILIITQRARVQAFVRNRTVSKRQLAIKAGLTASVLTGIESDTWDPTPRTLAALHTAVEAFELQLSRRTAKKKSNQYAVA